MLLLRVFGVIASVISLLCALVGESISLVISLIVGGARGIVMGCVSGGGGGMRMGGGTSVPPGLRGKGGGGDGGDGGDGGACERGGVRVVLFTSLLKLFLDLLDVFNGERVAFLDIG